MKKIFLFLSIVLNIFFYLAAFNAHAESIPAQTKKAEQSLDGIVAIVNDDIVTKTELKHALKVAKMQFSQNANSLPEENVFQKQVLDQLINKKIQLQLAKQAGIKISDLDLDKTIENIAKQNNISTEALYNQLHNEGMTTVDYRNEMREQLTLNKLQQQEIINRITISPNEVNNFIKSQVWQTNGTKEYRLHDILIPISDTPSTEEITKAKDKASQVLARLKQGQKFREVAQSMSGDQHALQGGDLGWRILPEIPSAFTEQVAHMQEKELAGPIQTPNGFHIIRLSAVRISGSKKQNLKPKEVEQMLLQRKFEEAMQNWVSKLRGQAFVIVSL